MKTLNLEFDHPREEALQEIVKAVMAEQKVREDKIYKKFRFHFALGPDEMSKDNHLPTLPARLEIVGEGRGTRASIYMADIGDDYTIGESVDILEDIKGKIARADPESMHGVLTRFEEFWTNLDLVEQISIDEYFTRGIEFRVSDGSLESVADYTGNFKSPGWRWSEHRGSDFSGKEGLRYKLHLVKDAYSTARRVAGEIERRKIGIGVPVKDQRFYGDLLTSLSNITDPKTEEEFIASLRG